MWYLTLALMFVYRALAQGNHLFQDCAKYYRPKNYLDTLAGIKMPYIDQVAIPNNLKQFRDKEFINNIKNIEPTPVMTTKVLTVHTKYVYTNPVCVKYSKKQKLCKFEDVKLNGNVGKIITKEHFLKNNVEERVESVVDVLSDDVDKFNLKVSFDRLEPSESDEIEQSRAFPTVKRRTPSLKPEQIHELLIEDRLNQLETILPGYQRRRMYETSTVYITKTLSNKRHMATLTVKNCVPVGYDVCQKRRYSRGSSKVTRRASDSEEELFYFG